MGNAISTLWIILIIMCVTVSNAPATDTEKRALKSNRIEVYNQVPGDAANIGEMFSRGMFYGRIRTNAFLWKWKQETEGAAQDNWSLGIGGSMIYKSAYLHGVGLTAGLYTSQNPWHMEGEDYKFARTGKDVFSRYQVAAADDYNMTVLAQAYLEYQFGKSSIRGGRQIFESLLTSSNDTKIIPLTFQGITWESGDIAKTQIKIAWLDKIKLRDHITFHHVLAYGDDPNDPNAAWTENDDSAMHKGLKLSKLRAAGISDDIYILQIENKSLPNLTLMANLTDVPDLVGSVTGEANYAIPFGENMKLTPGVRYLIQFDHGAGEIGGASLGGKITAADARGYNDPDSLEGAMLAAKIELAMGPGTYMVGYSKISDDADLVAPWRGFPTGGYTRAMGQYNWYANTATWMLQAGYDFGKAKLVPGFSVQARYALQDFDDRKPDVSADYNVLNVDLTEKIAAVPGLEVKLRTNFINGKADIIDMDGRVKTDPSASEYRLEMNYLF